MKTPALKNKYLRAAVFISYSLFVFWLVFGVVGAGLSDLFRSALEFIFGLIVPAVSESHPLFIPLDLIARGIVPVVIILLGFLPQVILLFGSMETGRILLGIGSTHPFLLGFGCTTVAVSSLCPGNRSNKSITRGLGFIPCSAKLPVVLLFAGYLGFGFLSIYLIYLALTVFAFIIKGKTKAQTASEITTVQKFNAKNILVNTRDFLKRISLTLIIFAAALYFFSNFNFGLGFTGEFRGSILYWTASAAEPLFIPIGLGNAAVIAVLVFGLMGKEMTIASLAIIGGGIDLFSTAGPIAFTMASAAAFLAFFMLYPTCVPAFGATASRCGRRHAIRCAGLNLVTAYLVSFFVYTTMLFFL